MAETAGGPMSLQGELEGSMQAIHRGEKLCCFHKPTKEKHCGNRLSKATLARLALIFKEIVQLLESGSKDVETLLKEASPLVMCVRRHQDEAAAKLKEWTVRIPARSYKVANSGDNVESLFSTSFVELKNDATPTGFSSEVQIIALPTVLDTQRIDRNLTPEPAQLSFKPHLDDSGYQSSNEEDFFQDQVIASKMTATAASSSSTEYATPQTPQKAAKPASTDSGISLSFDRSDENQTKRSIRCRDESDSPLAGKASRAKPVKGGPPFSRPALTPIQPISLSIRTKNKFVPFDDACAKMRKYIKKPLVGEHDMKDGYIYGFQLEGCAYTKIGYAAARESEPSLEASLDARIKEHKRAGWSDLRVVLKKRVPHVRRMEKIIHYHLEEGRMKEQCSCKRLNGQKCDHGNYTEWFNNSLDEIYDVVIAWTHWILSMPYSEFYGGRYHLSSEWKSCLENIRIQSDRDNWLEWLYEHVPELPRLISKTTLDTSGGIEIECTAEGCGSSLRNNATGLKVEIKRVKTLPLKKTG